MASGATEASEKGSASSHPDDEHISENETAGLHRGNKGHREEDSAGLSPDSGEASDTSENDATWVKQHNNVSEPSGHNGNIEGPPLPEEAIPPLPAEAPPAADEQDDGWAPIWEETAQTFYFYNRFTGATQWTNPRVPEVSPSGPPGVTAPAVPTISPPPTGPTPANGYNPAIHGDYDPSAWYAQPSAPQQQPGRAADPAAQYAATAGFNRFTGRYQNPDLNPENFNDENKSKRQMNAFFDVDAAANSHDGRSLKAERSGKKLSKTELKQFKEKRKAKKEEKRRAWLRD